jgi:hypothetical protein
MSTNLRDNRHYKSSPLPTLLNESRAQSQQDAQEILKMLYGEVCSSWRELMDTRFKLLGLVPSVSLVVEEIKSVFHSNKSLCKWQAIFSTPCCS